MGQLMKNIEIQNQEIRITGIDDNDYISLTDLARLKNSKEPKDVIKNWMRLRSTLEFLGLWEKLNNEFKFKPGTDITGEWIIILANGRYFNELWNLRSSLAK